MRARWIGRRIGAYEVVRLLGRGASASVFEVKHLALGRSFALKILHEHLADQEQSRNRFAREARNAAAIRHPNVVDVMDVGEVEGLPYFVMELLAGGDLASWLAAQGKLPLEEALAIVLPLASALEAAHRMDTIHRDLKPGNVVILRDARGRPKPKLVDFGLSKRFEVDSQSGTTAAGTLMGTAGYMPPEQLEDAGAADARSDQWGLAALLYHCLGGRPPYQATTLPALAEALRAPLPSLAGLAEGLPAPVVAAVMRGLSQDPAARFPSVQAFGEALAPFADPAVRDSFFDHLLVAPPPPTPTPDAPTVIADRPKPVLTKLPLPAGTSPFRAKGMFHRGFVQLVEHRVPGGMNAFLASLPPAHEQLATFARQQFLAASLYDFLPLVPLFEHLAWTLKEDLGEMLEAAGRGQLRYEQRTTASLSLSFGMDVFASRVTNWARRHYGFGDVVVRAAEPTLVRLERTGWPRMLLPMHQPSQRGYIGEGCVAMGARDVSLTYGTPEPDGEQMGVPLCRFSVDIRWQ